MGMFDFRTGFAVLLASSLGACVFDPQDPAPTDDPNIPDCDSFTDQLDSCLLPPASPLSLAGTLTFDTGTGELHNGSARLDIISLPLQTRGGEIHAIIASTVTIAPGSMLRATGPRGFAILASDTITIGDAALLDVSVGGAGARTLCPDGPALGTALADGAGGGGGAAFGGPGGRGGDGNDDGTASLGGNGGIALPTAPLGPLGGCPGAAGGYGDDPGGLGGSGGGVIFLASATSITIAPDAGLHAGGGGGSGGTRTSGNHGDAGGGGGGSGGMIFLEAPLVTSAGTLAANGGGGGEGSGNRTEGAPGDPGQLAIARASGGSGGSLSGTSGGHGGAIADLRGDPVTTRQNGGAGGGGGGAGFVIIVAPEQALGANVSPQPF
jgi:hypothetical protein